MFDSPDWVNQVSESLNVNDIIQPFSEACWLTPDNSKIRSKKPSYAYGIVHDKLKAPRSIHMYHPGFAWAFKREVFRKMGGFFDRAVIGNGDMLFVFNFIRDHVPEFWIRDVLRSRFILDTWPTYHAKIKELSPKIGYLTNKALHLFHGVRQNRQYTTRYKSVSHMLTGTWDEQITVNEDGLFEFNAPQMRELIRPHAEEYRRVVLRDQLPEGMDVKGALKVYRNFKLLRAAPSWGDYPMSCTCKTNFGHCVCGDTLLFVSLFDHKVQVPKGYVGATVSERKQCKKIGGLAGRRKRRVLEERQDDEKVIHSKAVLLAETPPPAAEAAPSPRDKAAAFIVPEAILPVDDDEDDDFQVTFCFGLWCHCTDSSCDMWVVQDQRTPHKRPWQGRGSSKLKLRPPPALAAPSSQPAARATSRPVPATRRSSTQLVSDRATKKSVRL
jgi:hypothetical protein